MLESRRKPSRWAKLILMALAVLLIPLTVEYERQASLRQQWEDRYEVAVQERSTAQALNAELRAEKDYVGTDQYVQVAARSRLRMSLPGETLVVVLPTLTPAPADPVLDTPTPEPSFLEWLVGW